MAPFISAVFAPNNVTFTKSKDHVSISIVHLLIYNLPVQSITKLCAGRVVFWFTTSLTSGARRLFIQCNIRAKHLLTPQLGNSSTFMYTTWLAEASQSQHFDNSLSTFHDIHSKVLSSWNQTFHVPVFVANGLQFCRQIPSGMWSFGPPALQDRLKSTKRTLARLPPTGNNLPPTPHNGRTVAPEAILFESPCRAHPET